MKMKPTCYIANEVRPEVYSGIPAFLGADVAKTKEDIKGHDFAVMGAPWEGTCTFGGYTGVELAPKAIRTASARYGGYLPDYDFDFYDHATMCDYGDCATKNGDYNFTFESVRNYMRDIVSAGAIPITFGGDHSLSFPLIEAFAEKYHGKIGVIHFDAHMDNSEEYGGEERARCCPFRRVYDIPGFNPKNLVSVGIHGPRNHYDSIKTAKKYGATVIPYYQLREDGWKKTIHRAIEIAGKGVDAIYVTVCSDGMDIAFNPGADADACGMSSFEMAMMLHECGLAGAKGFDYMEVVPPLDRNNVSGHVACYLTVYMLTGMAQRIAEEKKKDSQQA